MPDLVITPNRGFSATGVPRIDFVGASGSGISMQVLGDGSLSYNGTQGALFGIVDSLSGSLMSVSDIAGLPVLECFSDDRVVMGTFNSARNAVVVSGFRLGLGTASPAFQLDATGQGRFSGGLVLNSGLWMGSSNVTGGGIAWPDVQLYRQGAGILAINNPGGDSYLKLFNNGTVGGYIQTNGTQLLAFANSSMAFQTNNGTTALGLGTNQVATFSSGIILGSSNVTGGGIAFGSNVNLWTVAAGNLVLSGPGVNTPTFRLNSAGGNGAQISFDNTTLVLGQAPAIGFNTNNGFNRALTLDAGLNGSFSSGLFFADTGNYTRSGVTSVAQLLAFSGWAGNYATNNQTGISPVYKVNNVTDMTALNVAGLPTNALLYAEGYYSPSDGGEGFFYYSAGSAATVNSGTVFAPTVGAGRWLRMVDNNTVYADWFGAKGDGATDDRTRIQAALNYVSGVTRGTVYLNAKTYLISDYLTLNSNYTAFLGQGQNYSRLLINSSGNDVLRVGQLFSPNIAVPTVGNFGILRNTLMATGGVGISFVNTSLAKVYDIQSDGSNKGFYFSAATNSNIQRCIASCGNGVSAFTGFHWDGGQTGSVLMPAASSQMSACIVDATASSGQSLGMLLNGNAIADLYLYDFGTLRCSYGRLIDGTRASAIVPAYNWDIMMMDCTDDEYKIHGMLIQSNGQVGTITNTAGWFNPGASAGIGSAIYVQNSRGVNIQDAQIMNIGQLATSRGITIDSSTGVQLSNCQITDQNFSVYLLNGSAMNSIDGNVIYNQNTLSGSTAILMDTVSRNKVVNNTIYGANAVGIFDSATSSKNLFTQNIINPLNIPIPLSVAGAGDITGFNITT